MKMLSGLFCIAVLFFAPSDLLSQWICMHPPCHPCEDEIITPNLSVAKPVRLSGTVLYMNGEPVFSEQGVSLVQVRDQKSKTVFFSVPLDEKGHFELGRMPAGNYRFLVLWLKDGKVQRLPLADQPKALICSGETMCQLKILVQLHGTDDPTEFCPPK